MYKDNTGNMRFSAKERSVNISVAYQAWLDRNKGKFLFAFDAFRAGVEYAENSGPKWISVKDSLPSTVNDYYFCCTKDGSIMLVRYYEGMFANNPEIAYWMPYPLPPVNLQKPVELISGESDVKAKFEELRRLCETCDSDNKDLNI